MCQVAEILKEVLSEVRALPVTFPPIPDHEFVGPLIGRGIRARRSNVVPKKSRKPKNFNIDFPLWYKDVERNNASLIQSTVFLMEPKIMESKNTVAKVDESTEVKEVKEPTVKANDADTAAAMALAIKEAELRGYTQGISDAKKDRPLESRSGMSFMEGFKISSGLMAGVTFVSILGLVATRAFNNQYPEKEVQGDTQP